jgi:hypothetical protein
MAGVIEQPAAMIEPLPLPPERLAAEPPLSLLGGPLHRLGCRLGLVRHHSNTVPLGLAIGGSLWGVLVVLALIDGHALWSYSAIGPHARLLLVIPLLFVCESMLDPRVTEVARVLVRSGVVPAPEVPALRSLIERVTRLKDASLPEAICLLLALGLTWLVPLMQIPGTAGYGIDLSALHLEPADWWYWIVCLTVVRFLTLRWMWRLGLWYLCLWRISRLRLRLLPGHPDRAAGLSHLEVVQALFAPLVMAISIAMASSFASDIAGGKMAWEALLANIVVIVLVDAVLFVAPLLIFVPQMLACRIRGVREYRALAERYVHDFESKWLRPPAPDSEPLLGTADIQSLADLGTSLERVESMRLLPISLRTVALLLAAALLPMLPLALFKYPLMDLVMQFLTRLTGL